MNLDQNTPSTKKYKEVPKRTRKCQKVPRNYQQIPKNIARGTTDPEIDSATWTKFSDHKAWSADGATCINYKFGHQMAKLALVRNLATR